MTTTAPSTELAQAITDLKQVVASVEARLTNLEAQMGLSPVASMLLSCPYGMLGFHTMLAATVPSML
ncbi:hypothetical protein GUJ93_ZPchr0005g16277 [Zizania palustris]|uniref:Uncharacterized protein n=1 Tax=Zizania palustris TaxID=103762 RepID=A0A8J5SG48_ZIZPA|nr:hypothetical protein GUJ93_ZPchr0005g16277 [Zizania palustris]